MDSTRTVLPPSSAAVGGRPAKHYPKGEASGWLTRRRVLIAAEDPQARRFLAEALSRAGYSTDVAGPISDIRDHSAYSLLILQSGRAGLEVARDFRRLGGRLPIILIWGGPGEMAGPPTPELDPMERLTTPFTLPTLKQAIDRLVPGPKA